MKKAWRVGVTTYLFKYSVQVQVLRCAVLRYRTHPVLLLILAVSQPEDGVRGDGGIYYSKLNTGVC
jgi:hypothetical protein